MPTKTSNAVVPLLVGLLLPPPPAGAQQPPTFPAQAERVIVDVMVTDDEGMPVAGLTREDFLVEDEGAPQEIVDFQAIDVMAAAEAGEPAPGRIATNDDEPASARAFLIVFDDLNLTTGSAERARRALQRFLELQLRDADCVTIAPTAGGAWWGGCLGTDRADLVAALGAMRGRRQPDLTRERISDYEAMRIHVDNDQEAMNHVAIRLAAQGVGTASADITSRNPAENQLAGARAAFPLVRTMAADVYGRVRERNERTLRSVERGLRALGGGRGRRIVVLASDGFIRDQRLPEWRRVREAARRFNAAVYFVDAGSGAAEMDADLPFLPDPENRLSYAAVAHEYLAEENAGAESLAADTGGFTVSGHDLHPGLARISAESRVFYLLSYEPSEQGRDGSFRKIKVSVRRPGVKVRARSGYYAGPAAPQKAEEAGPPPAVRQALDALVEARDVSLRMTAYVLGDAADGRIKVLLAAEADPSDLRLEPKEGRVTGVVESYSTVAARDSGEVGSKELVHELALRPEALPGMATTWIPVTHAYELPPGRYQASLAVRDRASGRTGSVRYAFDVPFPRDLRLTTPVLTDVLAPGSGPDAAARPLPVARRTFAVGSRLACGVEVWGGPAFEGKLPVEVVYEVRRVDGTVVVRSNPKPVRRDLTGTRADVFKLTLNRPGEYELRLHARDPGSGEEATAVERFQVVAGTSGR